MKISLISAKRLDQYFLGRRTLMLTAVFFVLVIAIPAFADETSDVTKMANMSLADLLNTTVTSSAGRQQDLNDVANAIYVITSEDIERSGARDLADLLYRVPGLQVRALDGHQYGVGIREGGEYVINNILLLIDGAVMFDPLGNSIDWQNVPVSLDEIQRIEIIRGNPGVLYSSNDANGVINIITKSADTKNNYVSQSGGSQSFRESSIGVGENLSSIGLAIRAYFDNEFDQGFIKNNEAPNIEDRYLSDRDGARVDYTPSSNQRLSVIANNNQQSSTPNLSPGEATKTPGQTTSAIINYTNKVTDKYDFSFHFDHVEQLATTFLSDDAIVHTTSASTQHNFHYDLFGGHVTSVGGEWRYNQINAGVDNGITGIISNGNAHANQKILSFFAQDEWRPIDKLILTAGVREDENTLVIHHAPLYSPKVSALYHLTDTQSVWASSGETYRTPAFIDRYLSIFGGFVTGSTDLKPEANVTNEIGYRQLLLNQKLKIDATAFSSKTNDVIVQDIPVFPGPNGPYAGLTRNNGSLDSEGVELAVDYQYTNNFSFTSDYSYVYPHIKPETVNDQTIINYDTTASNNIVGLGARYTVNHIKLDFYAKYFEGYQYDGLKVRGYYKSFMRFSYDFKTPAVAGKRLDGTFFINVNDVLGARKVEDNEYYNIFIKPSITSGVTIKF